MTGPWLLAIVMVVLIGLPISAHFLRRSVRRFRAGPVEADLTEDVRETRKRVEQIVDAVEQVNRQVNHVPDPDAEPTVRELVKATHEQAAGTRADVALNTRAIARIEKRLTAVETAQHATNERLGAVGSLARQTADVVKGLARLDDTDGES